MGKFIGECVIVICAALAVVTNALVVGTVQRSNKDIVQLTQELYNYELQVDMYEKQLMLYENRLTELEAQVRFGLGQRYDIKEE